LSYGSYHPELQPLKDVNRREFFLLLALLIPTFLLGIFPNLILDTLHISVSSLIYELPNLTLTEFVEELSSSHLISVIGLNRITTHLIRTIKNINFNSYYSSINFFSKW
jgi:hypothetical protein